MSELPLLVHVSQRLDKHTKWHRHTGEGINADNSWGYGVVLCIQPEQKYESGFNYSQVYISTTPLLIHNNSMYLVCFIISKNLYWTLFFEYKETLTNSTVHHCLDYPNNNRTGEEINILSTSSFFFLNLNYCKESKTYACIKELSVREKWWHKILDEDHLFYMLLNEHPGGSIRTRCPHTRV